MGKRSSLDKVPDSFNIEEWAQSLGSAIRSGAVINGKVYKKESLTKSTDVLNQDFTWPTPVASDSGSEKIDLWFKRAIEKDEQGINLHFALRHAVQLWPTPAHRDYKGQNSVNHIKKSLKEGKNGSLGQLPNAVLYRTGQSGQLNPVWVEWLMGYPDNYTNVTKE